MSKTPEEILEEVSNMFFGKPAKRPRYVSPPCLVCKRPCKYARRVHPKCAERVGYDRVKELQAAYFKPQ